MYDINKIWNIRKKTALALLLVTALVVRLVCLQFSWNCAPLYDETDYLNKANEIVSKGVFPGAFRPPLYPYFLAGLLKVFGQNIHAVKFVQVLIGTISVLFVYITAKELLASEKAALAAAAIFAIYPDMVWYSCFLWSETFFIFLFLPCFYFLLKFHRQGEKKLMLLAGLLFGLSALTKSVVLYFAVFIIAWLVAYHRRDSLKLSAFFFAGAIIVISPWTIRNYLAFHRIVPIETNGMFNLYSGNNEFKDYKIHFEVSSWKPIEERYNSFGSDEAERERGALREAVRYIWREQPRWLFKKIYYEVPELWNPDSLALRHIRLGRYGVVDPLLVKVIVLCFIFSYFLLIFSAVFGLIYAVKGPGYWLVVLLLAYFNMIYVLTFGSVRFNLFVVPFLMFYGGYMISRQGVLDRRITSPRNLMGIAVSALFVAMWFTTSEFGFLTNMLAGDIYAPY